MAISITGAGGTAVVSGGGSGGGSGTLPENVVTMSNGASIILDSAALAVAGSGPYTIEFTKEDSTSGSGGSSGGSSGDMLASVYDPQNKATDIFAYVDAAIDGVDTGGGVTAHNDLSGRDNADAHPISAITGLQTALDGLAGTDDIVTAHNNLTGRDTADAHPISAITGLQDALDGCAGTDDIVTVHNSLTGRDTEDAHPISAITGLQDVLDTIPTSSVTMEQVEDAINDAISSTWTASY